MSIILGIDPGNTGAVAVLENGRIKEVHDMPLMALGKKQQVNAAALANLIAGIDPDCAGTIKAAYVERVGAMPGQGVASMFNFGMGYGVIQGILAALDVPLHLVSPQKWKKEFSLTGKDKDCARTYAQQIYPSAPLARKKDIGRADAILIGTYGYMQRSTRDSP